MGSLSVPYLVDNYAKILDGRGRNLMCHRTLLSRLVTVIIKRRQEEVALPMFRILRETSASSVAQRESLAKIARDHVPRATAESVTKCLANAFVMLDTPATRATIGVLLGRGVRGAKTNAIALSI